MQTKVTDMAVLTKDLNIWLEKRREIKKRGLSIGFVPTMGALHAGHRSLLERSRRENDFTLLSIYVNPTQFNDPEDLKKYPMTLERDLEIARQVGVDEVLAPDYQQMYPDGYTYRLSENKFSHLLCGRHRPGHFDGMLTVVMKLLHLAGADRCYFGEKDYQQLVLVQNMVKAFFIDTAIVACETVREEDGLAMSSRNVNLGPEVRDLAPQFHRVLECADSSEGARTQLSGHGFEVEYVEEMKFLEGSRRLAAVKVGGVRLIDNVKR